MMQIYQKKPYSIIFSVFLVIGLIGMIRANDPVSAGDELLMHVNIRNDGGDDLARLKIDDDDLDELSVRLFIYDLGVFLQTIPFDLKDGNNAAKFFMWDTANVEPGTYWVRLTVSNDEVRRVRHRVITIV